MSGIGGNSNQVLSKIGMVVGSDTHASHVPDADHPVAIDAQENTGTEMLDIHRARHAQCRDSRRVAHEAGTAFGHVRALCSRRSWFDGTRVRIRIASLERWPHMWSYAYLCSRLDSCHLVRTLIEAPQSESNTC